MAKNKNRQPESSNPMTALSSNGTGVPSAKVKKKKQKKTSRGK